MSVQYISSYTHFFFIEKLGFAGVYHFFLLKIDRQTIVYYSLTSTYIDVQTAIYDRNILIKNYERLIIKNIHIFNEHFQFLQLGKSLYKTWARFRKGLHVYA